MSAKNESARNKNKANQGHRISRRQFAAGAAVTTVAAATPLKYGLSASKLKVGILLPRSGPQGQIGIDCQRGADVGLPLLKSKGYPDIEFMLADTETKVDVARTQAEKLINGGAQLIIGCFDSGATMAAAQVTEQKNIPLVVNIAAVPKLTEQGYQWVFRNFPTGPMIVKDAFFNQKALFQQTGHTPKSVVLMHVNDTFGVSLAGALFKLAPRFKMPYKIVEKIAYDPYGRDFSAEIRKAKASKAEAVWMVSRLNDAIALTKEMVKQRWDHMGVMSTGPGWYEDTYMKATGKYGDDVISFVPWWDAKEAALQGARGGVPESPSQAQSQHQPHPHLRGAADHGRRLQARRLDQSAGAPEGFARDQDQGQRHHGAGHPLQREGPEPGHQELGDSEPRRQVARRPAQGIRGHQADLADARLA